MELWHGSEEIVRTPLIELCRPFNDYGAGFYCTHSPELAQEWAARSIGRCAFANLYELDTGGLKMLDLEEPNYNVLNWLAVLLEHRTFFQATTALAQAATSYITAQFSLDISNYDLIRGYRADDSYFSFARAFVSNQISLDQLEQAMRLGKLGIQTVLKSPRAFERIRFIKALEVDTNRYVPLRTQRDSQAREAFRALRAEPDLTGIYVRDILAREMTNDDIRNCK